MESQGTRPNHQNEPVGTGRVEGETANASFETITTNILKGDSRVKRFLSVFVTSMFLASAAFAADAMKEEKKADAKAGAMKEEKKADAKAGAMKEEKKADAKVGATKEEKKADAKATEKKAEPAKGGEKAKGEAKGDVKASEKAKDAKAGAMGEEKKASK